MTVDIADVVAALNDVAATLRRRSIGYAGVATFYAWYDQQAGQLRCSLCSLAPDSLPFGGSHFTTQDAAVVVRLAAADPHPGHVPWNDLTEITDETEHPADMPPAPFPVWWSPVGDPDQRPAPNH